MKDILSFYDFTYKFIFFIITTLLKLFDAIVGLKSVNTVTLVLQTNLKELLFKSLTHSVNAL